MSSATVTIPAGYKLTEVGVIPEDWDIHTIGDSVRLINGRAFKPEEWKENGMPIIRIQNLNDAESTFNYFSGAVEERHRVEPGDLLFAWSGTTGTSFGARIWRGPAGVLNQHIFKVLPNQKQLTLRYAFLVLRKIQEHIEKQAHGFKASFVHVKKSDIVGVLLPLPPTKAEQEAIVEALSDADALIESLEQIVAKKRQIKQGAMQELLTGRKRLPGFIGAWKVKCLGEILTICHGKSQHEVENSDGPYPILATGGEIGRADRYIYDKPSVLIGRKGTIDRPQYMETPFWTVDTLFFSIIYEPNQAKFIFYQFCLIDWKRHNEASGVPSLNARTIEKIEIACPEPDEQTAIAAILSDLDAEIAALEDKLAKARQLKQGMMQELLTGRIRLV